MCLPQKIPSDWLFDASWLDGVGPYICATFVDPELPHDTEDTQLLLGGKTVEELACDEKVNPRMLNYEMVLTFFEGERYKRYQGKVLERLKLTQGDKGPFECQK